MTKEEFQKKFKVGDEITFKAHCKGVIKHLGDFGVYCEGDGDGWWHGYLDNDLEDFKKVEPVKKYWKHIYKAKGDSEIYVRYFTDNMKAEVVEYLKEPTEITLDEI